MPQPRVSVLLACSGLAALVLAAVLAPATGSAQAPPAEPAPAPKESGTSAATLERLRAEHAAIKDALFRSRARRETVATALLSTQLATVLNWEGGKRHVLKAAELRLDGVRLWDAAETPPGDRPIVLAPRGLAPGTHVLSVRIDVRARDNPKLGYVSEQTFTLVLDEGKKTNVEVTVDEDGSLPDYNPDIEVDVSTD